MKMYEQMNQGETTKSKASKVDDLLTKFKPQSLEEVTERSEESDMTSIMSYNSIDLMSSSDNNRSFDGVCANETNIRIRVIDEIDKMTKERLTAIFGNPYSPTVPFTYDFEDFENCKLNIDIKKLISVMDLTLPIVFSKKEGKYLVGTKKLELLVKGQFIHYVHEGSNEVQAETVSSMLQNHSP